MRRSYYALQHLPSKKKSLHFTSVSQTQHVPVQKLRDKIQQLADLFQSTISGFILKMLHANVLVLGLRCDVFLANILLGRYGKSGSLRDAREVFDKMCDRNLISWSSVISMYARHNYNSESLQVFLEFHRNSDERPNEYILASVFKACTQLGDILRGSQVHTLAVRTGLDQDVYVGTSLLDFYAKIGDIDKARLVFDWLSVKTAVTWTSILTGYVKNGKSQTSLELFKQMRDADVVPDRYVLSSVLSACLALGAIDGGKQIHGYMLRRGEEMDVSVVNALLDTYTKCGRVHLARTLFDQMEHKDSISWTTMIAGYMQNSYHTDAMKMFLEMTRSGWNPDSYACTTILSSCGSVEAWEQGRQVHAFTIKAGIEEDAFVKNGLIDFYAKCISLADARLVFDSMIDRNVVSYNTMIEGYAMQERLSDALCIFCKMRLGIVSPSPLTFVSILGCSAALCELELSRQIHCLMIKHGVSQDIFSGSSLIDVYSKSSCIKDARLVFEEMSGRDIVVWNAMLFGYTQQFEDEEALKLYLALHVCQENPNEFTFAAVITAASNLASLMCGQQLHGQLIKTGSSNDPFVTNALVDMYAKCGSIEQARKSFDCSVCRDVSCWNSMITTYAQHGEPLLSIHMFEEMMSIGIRPNYITYVGVLSACGHAGLVEDGLRYFKLMHSSGIEPGTEHYACIVSLLGRGGRLAEAKDFIEKMPVEPAPVIWRSLLSACRITGNVELGRYAAEMAISIDPTDSGSYTLLSNIYASKEMWVDVKKVRAEMDRTGVVKEPGKSWIELGNEVSVFVARDMTHNKADTIYSVLSDLILQMKDTGYVPDVM